MGPCPQPVDAEMGAHSGDFSAAKGNPQREAKRKAMHSLSCSSSPILFSRVPCEQLTFPAVASIEEQHGTNTRLVGKRKEGRRGCRGRGIAAAGGRREAALQVSDHAATKVWEKVMVPVGRCWEKAICRKRGQGLQQFSSGTRLEEKLATGIEGKLRSSSLAKLGLLGHQEGLGSPGKKSRHSLMELKLQIPCPKEELVSPERSDRCTLSEPVVLGPGKDAGSLMALDLQIPDSEKETVSLSERSRCTMVELGLQEEVGRQGKRSRRSFSEPRVLRPKEGEESPVKRGRCLLAGTEAWVEAGNLGKRGRRSLSVLGPQEKVGSPGKRDRCFLTEVRMSGPLDEKRSLGEKGRQSLVEVKLKSPGKRGRHSLAVLQPQRLSLQEEPVSPGKRFRRSLQLQNSGTQEEVGSLEKRGKHSCTTEESYLQSSGPQESTGSPRIRDRHSMVVLQPHSLGLHEGACSPGRRGRSSSVELWLPGPQKEAGTCGEKGRTYLGGAGTSEHRKRSRGSSADERVKMVTWAASQSRLICGKDYEAQCWRPGRGSAAGNTRGSRRGKMEQQQVVGQEVDSTTTDNLFISRIEDNGERQKDGKEEAVVSAELKLKIRKPTKKKIIEVKEDSDAQDGKQLETDLNISKDYNIKKPLVAYSESLQVAKSDGTQRKIPVCPGLKTGSTEQCNRRRNRLTKTRCLQNLDVKVTENKATKSKLVKSKDEKCRETPNYHNSLPSTVEKNPVVKLYDCRYLNTFVKSSVDATNCSYKIGGGFLHVAQGKRETFCPDSVMGQSDVNSKLNVMQMSTQKSISFDKEGICQNRKNCQNENSKCLRERKWSIDRKPRKRMKLFEKSSVQNVLPVMDNKYCEYELHMEDKTATTDSLAVLELNSNETTSSSSFDQKSNPHLEPNTQEAQNGCTASINRKMHLKPCATEGSFENRLQLSEIAKGEKGGFDSESIEQQDRLKTSNSPEVVTLVSDNISDYYNNASCQKRESIVSNEKLISNVEKLQLYSCQRIVPMSGKNVWPRESCARTSEWFHKNHVSVLEGKTSTSGSQECSYENNTEAVRDMVLTDNSRQLELSMLEAESVKESACKITMESNIECLTSVRTPESSSLDICGTLRVTCNENLESSVDSSPIASKSEAVHEAQVILNLAVKQKQDDKNKGALTKKNLMMALHDGISEDDNTSKMIVNHKTSMMKKTVTIPNLMKMLYPGNLSNFKIPLRKNKTESRKVDCIRSLDKETYSPLERLHKSAAASARQNRAEENSSMVVSEQQPISEEADISVIPSKENADQMSSKDFGSGGSESLSNEINILSEHVSTYQCAFLEGELESSALEDVTDSSATAPIEQSRTLDYSSKTVDHSVSLEMHDDDKKKSRMDLAQSKIKNFPDVLKAYEDDILVIDVIQDDPDLFGTTDEGELAFTMNHVTEKHCNISTTSEEKQDVKPKCLILPETKDSRDYFRESPIQESGTLKSGTDSYDALLMANKIQKHDSSSGSCPLGGVIEESFEDGQLIESDELLKDFHMDEKYSFSGKSDAIKEEKVNIHEAEKSNDSKYIEFVSSELQLGLQLPSLQINAYQEDTVVKPWISDFRYSGKSSLLPLPNSDCYEPWKMDKNVSHLIQQNLGMIELPRKYCRFYFSTLRGCERVECWFWHVPEQGDEKICMAILKTYININESSLLQRSVQIFMNYYREVTPGVHFDSQVLNDLLISLIKCCLLKEVFQLLNVAVMIKMLPAVDVFLKVFEHVASMNIRDAVPSLIDIFCKLFDAGMVFELEHFNCIIKFLHQLQVSSQEINVILNMKSRFQARQFKKNWLCDLNLAIAEIQHCKEKSDWAKLGTLYVNMRIGCENFGDLQKLTLYIADILTRDSKEERPGVPFCEFAEAVIKNPQYNEADKDFLGRTGISVMYSYHTLQQWSKGRKVLDKLHELQIHFTSLKGLIGPERLASRCQIVNAAAEIFLKSGSLDGATWVLRESEWIINTPLWPCDRMDVLNRHNLLCAIACECLTENLYRQAFGVLQNLPGFQNCCDTVDVSQYSLLFNKLLDACIESKGLGISSSVTDFMLSKNIPIDFTLIRGLITALGRSCLWLKARIYYKSALSLGCYPPLEGNLYRKLLLIPSYMSEIEMLLAIEIFLVSNASNIQSPGATNQTLQIVLKRSEEQKVRSKDDYQAAVERLIQAARISNPKLFLKHMTMNVNMEQVYSLEHNSALKWLKENMKWAGKVWLFSSH
ncbi:protein TOPAZ1 [Emys orbicularis]|uniref:protein TOPAZ1 n=1 Tax=Emys orbicularis TaxID=82168 RepID=UPI0031FDF203